jgi:hypothetical protein
MRLPALELTLTAESLRQSFKYFLINETPRSATAGRFGLAALMFGEASQRVIRTAYVESLGTLALQE